ncbi:hypothetical protein BD626DRAFT_482546 [Schizophyllum amplum]|uniref:Uncharacterized protein n=1 Tax=Schizophyllum amplum TaxID=97359 RepID=A0A550CVA5_9AGAR|nr:hypothetical protein BD626DRAFT_482546 [Auriculariopsis ampla]
MSQFAEDAKQLSQEIDDLHLTPRYHPRALPSPPLSQTATAGSVASSQQSSPASSQESITEEFALIFAEDRDRPLPRCLRCGHVGLTQCSHSSSQSDDADSTPTSSQDSQEDAEDGVHGSQETIHGPSSSQKDAEEHGYDLCPSQSSQESDYCEPQSSQERRDHAEFPSDDGEAECPFPLSQRDYVPSSSSQSRGEEGATLIPPWDSSQGSDVDEHARYWNDRKIAMRLSRG